MQIEGNKLMEALASVPVTAQPWTKIWSQGIGFNINMGLAAAGGAALLWLFAKPLLAW